MMHLPIHSDFDVKYGLIFLHSHIHLLLKFIYQNKLQIHQILFILKIQIFYEINLSKIRLR